MKNLIRIYHRIKSARAHHRASIIRRDLMIYIEHEMSRERQLRALAEWHTARATPPAAPEKPKGQGLAALIPGARKQAAAIIKFPKLNSLN